MERISASIISAGTLVATLALPTFATAQHSTTIPPATPNIDCSVSGGCPSTGTGNQPNTTPDSTQKGGSSGSTSGGNSGSSGTLDNTSPGSSVDPGDSSGSGNSGNSGSSSGSGGAAGPLGNSTPD